MPATFTQEFTALSPAKTDERKHDGCVVGRDANVHRFLADGFNTYED